MNGDEGTLRRSATIRNQRGLHARAAAKFAKLAGNFQAEIQVSRNGTSVSGVSIMGLMMLAAAIGVEIDLEARGPQAQGALDALVALIDARFDEEE
ncbi:MAG: HPr family phosphocarrier protein [Magnetospirillum sp. WYHS-4]